MLASSLGCDTIILSDLYPEVPVGAVQTKLPVMVTTKLGDLVVKGGLFVHRLKVGCNTLGRLADNDIIIKDETRFVSRRHCSIVVHTDGSAEVFDTSLNGTFVNGKRVLRSPVRSGDTLRLGPYISLKVILYND